MTENKIKWFKPEISVETILTIAACVVSVTLAYAALDKDNALQNQRIDNNQSRIETGLQRERNLTRESVRELKDQAAMDRQEMRHQFERLNEKLDKLISEGKK